jgi:SMP-30/Gluconolactonase/LRE-like region
VREGSGLNARKRSQACLVAAGTSARLGAVGLTAAALLAITAPSAQGTCAPWGASTVLSGQGALENLAFDRRGAMFLSAIRDDAILRLGRDRNLKTLIAGVHAPGGLRVRRGVLYFNTGDDIISGIQGLTDGTLERYRLEDGRRSIWAQGLTMPNGLVFLPNGDAVVSRDFGQGTGMTRIPADDPANPEFNWARLDDTNGMAKDPKGRWLYTVETFNADSRVFRVRISNPSRIQVVASLGNGTVTKGLDDMTIDGRGRLYITANLAGEVIRLNPKTGASCVIASGLQNPSSVKFGRGRGWSQRSLYVTAFDGTVTRLAPPLTTP